MASSANSRLARLIAIDRPGMGLSTFQPNRSRAEAATILLGS